MIKAEREARIVDMVSEVGAASIRDLAVRLGGVSEVTVRRDVARLTARGMLKRSHGGVSRIDRAHRSDRAADSQVPFEPLLGDVEGIVLPPLEGKGAETLRLMARRRHIPFLAELAAQAGGVYLGADNFAAGRELGEVAARQLGRQVKKAKILLVSLEALPNTRTRCDGFLKGLTETFAGDVEHWRVDGRGIFKHALRASLDALQAHPDINVLFGVNDHSILAAIDASDRLRLDQVIAFSVGGEGGALFDALIGGHKLVACSALFPEIVGRRAVEMLSAALRGSEMPEEVRTPHAVVTRETLSQFYHKTESGWVFAPAADPAAANGAADRAPSRAARGRRPRIGFVPHYPAHDWYRSMEKAMRARAEELGLDLVVAAPQAGIAQEIRSIRRVIARAAARLIAPGDTILINQGEACIFLAEELKSATDLTVVTNSLDVLERLSGAPGVKVILTSGELHSKYRCLVGPSLGALFETLRVDKAFISVDGISARFGPSASDERMALAARRFIHASREVHVLADHSLVGQEANHRIAPLDQIDEVITDTGSLPGDRLAFASAGTSVSLADEETGAKDERPTYRPVGPLAERKRPSVMF